MKLIDKDALVAEIERLKSADLSHLNGEQTNIYLNTLVLVGAAVCNLEVKEVNLEHEVESYWKQCDMTWCRDAYSMTHIRSMLSDIAKYFFELGIAVSNKAQKDK